jgi:membrane protease YdiL (CAAX protease family)
MFQSLWKRLPVVVTAVLTGSLVAAAGTLPWAYLVSANTRHWSVAPWSVPITAVYLWLYWRYVRGSWWPASTAEARRANCRANRLPEGLWGMAMFAGILGLVAVLLFQRVMNRMAVLPRQQDLDISQFPVLTVVSWIVTSAVVAGVVEESAFRGYMQSPIERRHGPVISILITGIIFGFMHFTHPEVTMILMPYYVAVAGVYGAMAYFTDSIYPSMVLHAGGNMLSAFDVIARGRSEWQASPTPAPLIWETGTDAAFWISAALFLLAGTATLWAFSLLGKASRETPGPA